MNLEAFVICLIVGILIAVAEGFIPPADDTTSSATEGATGE